MSVLRATASANDSVTGASSGTGSLTVTKTYAASGPRAANPGDLPPSSSAVFAFTLAPGDWTNLPEGGLCQDADLMNLASYKQVQLLEKTLYRKTGRSIVIYDNFVPTSRLAVFRQVQKIGGCGDASLASEGICVDGLVPGGFNGTTWIKVWAANGSIPF